MTAKALPPPYLTAASKKWWRSVVSAFELEPSDLRLLEHAAACWDRAEEARKLVTAEGAVIDGRFPGQRVAHPGVGIERDARTLHARLLRELNLDLEPPAESRPPRRY